MPARVFGVSLGVAKSGGGGGGTPTHFFTDLNFIVATLSCGRGIIIINFNTVSDF